jgi:prevent-host-death family protein
MKEETISVTEAARNFAECVNRVRYQGMTLVLLKNGKPVARLVPEGEKTTSAQKLAAALRKFDLTPEEARAWQRDLRAARRILKPPVDKWRE